VLEKKLPRTSHRPPKRRKKRQPANDPHARNPSSTGEGRHALAQTFHVQTGFPAAWLCSRCCPTDLPAHPAVLGVHEVVAGGQSNLAGRLDIDSDRPFRKPVLLRASSAMHLPGWPSSKIVAGQVRSGTRTPILRSQKSSSSTRAKESMPAWDRELFSSKFAPSGTKLVRANSQSCAAIVLGLSQGHCCVGRRRNCGRLQPQKSRAPPKNRAAFKADACKSR